MRQLRARKRGARDEQALSPLSSIASGTSSGQPQPKESRARVAWDGFSEGEGVVLRKVSREIRPRLEVR